MKIKRGRKTHYSPESLKIGETMALKQGAVKYGHQMAYHFNLHFPKMKFKFVDGLIKRIK